MNSTMSNKKRPGRPVKNKELLWVDCICSNCKKSFKYDNRFELTRPRKYCSIQCKTVSDSRTISLDSEYFRIDKMDSTRAYYLGSIWACGHIKITTKLYNLHLKTTDPIMSDISAAINSGYVIKKGVRDVNIRTCLITSFHLVWSLMDYGFQVNKYELEVPRIPTIYLEEFVKGFVWASTKETFTEFNTVYMRIQINSKALHHLVNEYTGGSGELEMYNNMTWLKIPLN